MLKFQHFQTIPDVTFWSEFTKLKLQEWKLAETAVPIHAHYTCSANKGLPGPLKLDENSFHPREPDSNDARICIPGELLNYNTIEGFKKADRKALLKQVGNQILRDIKSGAAEQDPRLLNRFLLTSYADLKSYKFYYWFAFPALKMKEGYAVECQQSLDEVFGEEIASRLAKDSNAAVLDSCGNPCFWACPPSRDSDGNEPFTIETFANIPKSAARSYLCMIDTSGKASEYGWPLRNVLFLMAAKLGWRTLSVICWNSRHGALSAEHSTVVQVSLPNFPSGWLDNPEYEPEVSGWAPNQKGVLAPKMVDLGSSMDPQRFAESAADLNIRLMKWRAAPSLDLDKLAKTKCLLLGAGTLGCAVARTLMGWGVRQITFVDNSKVSYSNPVRQSLYEFDDCLGEGQPKAKAAAEKLRKIFPAVQSEGLQMSIPMPGHPLVGIEIEEAKTNAARLEELIRLHDTVFLLMDTRESRWLPTLLCAVHNKLAINAALGFDSYLVMRHGGRPGTHGEHGKHRLGCYYCNDVVAPLNSTVDRTLDQQCTVARPGLAPIAGALAVEMMAAVVQHPDGVQAPAPSPARSNSSSSPSDLPLGAAPHMIRGQMGNFSQISLVGQSFSQCTACSSTVVEGYKTGGWEWLLGALQRPQSLEDLTGLTKLMQQMMRDQEGSDHSMLAVDSDEDFEEI